MSNRNESRQIKMDFEDDSFTKEEPAGPPIYVRILKILFSQIGLTLLVVAYSCAGGVIFESIEKENNLNECIEGRQTYEKQLNETTNIIWQELARTAETSAADESRDYVRADLDEFRLAFQDGSYNGLLEEACADRLSAWSFYGSFLFCITVITTIGYGHIYPVTFWGKLVCITYAVLGIPLMLILLANIGDVLADMFKYVYSHMCCCECCRDKDLEQEQRDKERGKQRQAAWRTDETGKPIGPGPTIIEEDSDDEDEEEDDIITVPLTVTLLVMALWVMFGALLFSLTEEWEVSDAAYFSFVTVSTIGFGDMVPGLDNLNTWGKIKMVITGIYMLIGMALISMCFTLMQDEVVAKAEWIGEKFGLGKKDNEDDDSDSDLSSDESDNEIYSTQVNDFDNTNVQAVDEIPYVVPFSAFEDDDGYLGHQNSEKSFSNPQPYIEDIISIEPEPVSSGSEDETKFSLSPCDKPTITIDSESIIEANEATPVFQASDRNNDFHVVSTVVEIEKEDHEVDNVYSHDNAEWSQTPVEEFYADDFEDNEPEPNDPFIDNNAPENEVSYPIDMLAEEDTNGPDSLFQPTDHSTENFDVDAATAADLLADRPALSRPNSQQIQSPDYDNEDFDNDRIHTVMTNLLTPGYFEDGVSEIENSRVSEAEDQENEANFQTADDDDNDEVFNIFDVQLPDDNNLYKSDYVMSDNEDYSLSEVDSNTEALPNLENEYQSYDNFADQPKPPAFIKGDTTMTTL